MEKELVAVGDESGLKKMIDSDESDSDSNDDDISKLFKAFQLTTSLLNFCMLCSIYLIRWIHFAT